MGVTKITDYKDDNTGGPRGQLAVHPAAGQFILDNAAHTSRPYGINAVDAILDHTGGAFKLVNGYLEMPKPLDAAQGTQFVNKFREKAHTSRPLVMADVP